MHYQVGFVDFVSRPLCGEFDFLLDQIPTFPVLGGVGLNIDRCITLTLVLATSCPLAP